jgi:hypothetical protein
VGFILVVERGYVTFLGRSSTGDASALVIGLPKEHACSIVCKMLFFFDLCEAGVLLSIASPSEHPLANRVRFVNQSLNFRCLSPFLK